MKIAKWVLFVISLGFIAGDYYRQYQILLIESIVGDSLLGYDLKGIIVITVVQLLLSILFMISLSEKIKKPLNMTVCVITVVYIMIRIIMALVRINSFISPTAIGVELFYCLPYLLFIFLSVWARMKNRREKLC